MLIDPLSDGHIHTSFCNHAVGTMEDYTLSAIDKGLREIIFLEHMEEGIRSARATWLSEKDFDYYFDEGHRLQQKYANHISIGLGVEVGYNPQCREKLRERLLKRKWNRVGISYHFHEITKTDFHLNLVSRKDTRVANLSSQESFRIERIYYESLIEAINFLPGTVLCHLDAVLRHHPQRKMVKPPWPLIDMLLDNMKTNQVALEINTSGMAIRKEFFPVQKIVAMAVAKGIPLVAGSDAHKPEDIGNHFDLLDKILK